jgi:hypothetical protein
MPKQSLFLVTESHFQATNRIFLVRPLVWSAGFRNFLVNDHSVTRLKWVRRLFLFPTEGVGSSKSARILAGNMINLIKKLCMCATYLTVHVIVYFVTACVHLWNRKSQAKLPTWGNQAKQTCEKKVKTSINS